MDVFTQLGDNVYREWRARDFDESVFHEIAVTETRRLPPSEHVSPDEVITWVHDALRLPPQQDVTAKFGQPPITVYRSDRFYIDVLFWVESTTSIHQHSFSGAFHVLAGSSLQSEYRFFAQKRYSDRLMIGRLDLQSVELLKKGDVRPIRAGANGTIHALFHLDNPSVSVVVRTGSDPLSGPQYTYQRHGVAYDPFLMTDALARQAQTLHLLHKLKRPDFVERARRTVEHADAFRMLMLLSEIAGLMSEKEYVEFLDTIQSPHEELVSRLRQQRDEVAREFAIIDRRKRVQRAEHRFLLALLLNVPSRKRMLDIIADAFPADRSPRDTAMAWIAEMAATRLEDGKNLLDIELDETGLRILNHILDGASDQQIFSRLREEYDDVETQQGAVLDMCRAFRRSYMFRYLNDD